ncbi:MAG: hypothetical protein JJE52_01960 [Acidimicrobiia bacterium]|nr:hypothetical protein [Acidimicrobiia bacterium]
MADPTFEIVCEIEPATRPDLTKVRNFSAGPGPSGRAMRAGVTSDMRPLPAWKAEADFVFAQVSYSLDELAAWRGSIDFDGPIYAGVMVLASAAMGRKLGAQVPQLAPPDEWVDAVERDPAAGVELACQHVLDIRDHGGFAGVHLVPVSRYREAAARLEPHIRRAR